MLNKSTLKYIVDLQQKKFRDASGEFVAEGPKLIDELITSPHIECTTLYALSTWILEHGQHYKNQTDIVEVADYELKKMSSLSTPNQVLGVFKKPSYTIPTTFSQGCTLILDDIQDPGNLGTIIRTADWFGVSDIICSPHTADMYNPKVVQSTMASIARVRVHYTELIPFLQSQHLPVLAAILKAEPMEQMQKPYGAFFMIMGNESKGISATLLPFVSQSFSIKGGGGAESLNVAVATAIALHHFK